MAWYGLGTGDDTREAKRKPMLSTDFSVIRRDAEATWRAYRISKWRQVAAIPPPPLLPEVPSTASVLRAPCFSHFRIVFVCENCLVRTAHGEQ